MPEEDEAMPPIIASVLKDIHKEQKQNRKKHHNCETTWWRHTAHGGGGIMGLPQFGAIGKQELDSLKYNLT